LLCVTELKQVISYEVLLHELDIADVRQLEDLVIECIYSGVFQGKLNQRAKQLVVENAIGRDVKADEITRLQRVLDSWYSSSCCGCCVRGLFFYALDSWFSLRCCV
jgi:COP9 signalosome complex subunit 7